eukprot:g7745.t1
MMNWRQIYGDAEFSLRPSVYWSDIIRRKNRRNVDLDDLKKRAETYARNQCVANSIEYEEVIKGETEIKWPPMKKEVDLEARVERDDQRKAAQLKAETTLTGESHTEESLPPGWATAKDANGRTYYWHRETKATQWDKPT